MRPREACSYLRRCQNEEGSTAAGGSCLLALCCGQREQHSKQGHWRVIRVRPRLPGCEAQQRVVARSVFCRKWTAAPENDENFGGAINCATPRSERDERPAPGDEEEVGRSGRGTASFARLRHGNRTSLRRRRRQSGPTWDWNCAPPAVIAAQKSPHASSAHTRDPRSSCAAGQTASSHEKKAMRL